MLRRLIVVWVDETDLALVLLLAIPCALSLPSFFIRSFERSNPPLYQHQAIRSLYLPKLLSCRGALRLLHMTSHFMRGTSW